MIDEAACRVNRHRCFISESVSSQYA